VNIQGKTVSPKQKTAAPWDVIDSRQEARDIFKKNQFQRFHADDLVKYELVLPPTAARRREWMVCCE